MNAQSPCIATGSTTSSGRGSKARRLLDRYAGIPLVAAAGLLRKKRDLPSHPERIALLNTAAIGDTILMSAVVADLRDRYSDAELILLAGPSNHEVAHLIPELDLVVLLDIFNPHECHSSDPPTRPHCSPGLRTVAKIEFDYRCLFGGQIYCRIQDPRPISPFRL